MPEISLTRGKVFQFSTTNLKHLSTTIQVKEYAVRMTFNQSVDDDFSLFPVWI